MSETECSEDALIAAMDSRTFPPEAFTHREHVRLAWACLKRYPLLEALAQFRQLIIGFATHIGKPELYHETVTIAYLLLVYERMARGPGDARWAQFSRENSDLLTWKGGPFFDFYEAQVLTDRTARFWFVLPASAAARSLEPPKLTRAA